MSDALAKLSAASTADKRQSRNDARYFRSASYKGSDERCEVCGFFCGPIANIHHVVPVNKGGNGSPSNLIALCPNCHAAIHRLRDTRRTGDEIGLMKIGSWIECMYTPAAIRMMGSIAFETAVYDRGKWVARDSILSQDDA